MLESNGTSLTFHPEVNKAVFLCPERPGCGSVRCAPCVVEDNRSLQVFVTFHGNHGAKDATGSIALAASSYQATV